MKICLPVGLFKGQELRWFWESQATSSETRRGEELKRSARDKLRRKDRKCWLVTSVQSCCKVVTRTIFPILNLLFPSAEHRPCHIVWALRSPRHSLALRIFRWGSRPCPPELGLVSICLISVFSLRVICLLRAHTRQIFKATLCLPSVFLARMDFIDDVLILLVPMLLQKLLYFASIWHFGLILMMFSDGGDDDGGGGGF